MLRLTADLLINLVIVLWTGGVIVWYYRVHNAGKPKRVKRMIFRYFTTLSNLLSALACLIALGFELYELASGAGAASLPAWVVLLSLAGTVSVALTFMTVLVFLLPTMGAAAVYSKDGIYMHAVGPLLAMAAFVLLKTHLHIGFPLWLLGMVPVLLYGPYYMNMVVFKGEEHGGWPDFYGFNANGRWPLAMVIIFTGSALLSLLLAWAHNLCAL